MIMKFLRMFLWLWRLDEIAGKVTKFRDEVSALSDAVDARLDKQRFDVDKRLDETLRELNAEVAYIRGRQDGKDMESIKQWKVTE